MALKVSDMSMPNSTLYSPKAIYQVNHCENHPQVPPPVRTCPAPGTFKDCKVQDVQLTWVDLSSENTPGEPDTSPLIEGLRGGLYGTPKGSQGGRTVRSLWAFSASITPWCLTLPGTRVGAY